MSLNHRLRTVVPVASSDNALIRIMMLVEEWKEGSHMLTAARSLLKRLILCGAIGSTLLGGSFALPLVAQAHQDHHQSITRQCKHCSNSNNGSNSGGGGSGGSSSSGGH